MKMMYSRHNDYAYSWFNYLTNYDGAREDAVHEDSLHESVQRLAVFIRRLRKETDERPIFLAGVSQGGCLALHFASLYPDLIQKVFVAVACQLVITKEPVISGVALRATRDDIFGAWSHLPVNFQIIDVETDHYISDDILTDFLVACIMKEGSVEHF